MRRYATLQNNYLSFLIYTYKNLDILRVWDNERKNIKLGQAEFFDMGSLSRYSAFNVAAWEFTVCLVETWTKGRPQ